MFSDRMSQCIKEVRDMNDGIMMFNARTKDPSTDEKMEMLLLDEWFPVKVKMEHYPTAYIEAHRLDGQKLFLRHHTDILRVVRIH